MSSCDLPERLASVRTFRPLLRHVSRYSPAYRISAGEAFDFAKQLRVGRICASQPIAEWNKSELTEMIRSMVSVALEIADAVASTSAFESTQKGTGHFFFSSRIIKKKINKTQSNAKAKKRREREEEEKREKWWPSQNTVPYFRRWLTGNLLRERKDAARLSTSIRRLGRSVKVHVAGSRGQRGGGEGDEGGERITPPPATSWSTWASKKEQSLFSRCGRLTLHSLSH